MVIMDTPESIGNLEEQALKRKERLKGLKRKNPGGDNTLHDAPDVIVPLPKPKFRSYKPQDESLKEAKLDDAEPAAVEDEVKDLLEAGKEKHKGMPLKKEEVMYFLNLVEKYPVVYTRSTVPNSKLKDAAWTKITNQFNNGINTHPRKPEQLRLKWENLKKNARKRNFPNTNLINHKTEFGVPDYVQPDEVLDRVSAILGPVCEGYGRQYSGDGNEADEPEDMSTVIVIPSPSDDDEIAGPIDCVEVGVGGEACPSGVAHLTSTPKESGSDQRKRSFAQRTSGKSVHQNLMTTEVESRIIRNNAIAEYYVAKKKKIEEEIIINRDILILQKKKIELEMLELQHKKGSATDKDKLLLEKKQVELEILEIQRKKYSAAASLFRAASEGI